MGCGWRKPGLKLHSWFKDERVSHRKLPKENQTLKEEGEITLLRPLIPQTAIGLLTTEGDSWHTKPGLWDNLEGSGGEGGRIGVQDGGDTCTPMASSC